MLTSLHAGDRGIIELTNWKYISFQSENDSTFSDLFKINSQKQINWLDIQNPSKIISKNGELIFLKTALPEQFENNSALYVGQVTYPMKVFLNSKLIYEIGSFQAKANKYIRWNQVIIDLPNYQKNSELVFEIQIGKEFNGFFEKVLISPSISMLGFLIKSDLFNIIFLAFSLFTGIVTWLFYYFANKTRLMLAFTMFLFSVATLLFVNLSIVQLLINLPMIFLHLNYIMLGLAFIFIFIIVEEVVNPNYRFWINLIWKIRIAILLVTISLISLTDLVYFGVVKYVTIYTVLSFIVALLLLYLSASKRSYESKVLFVGILGIVFSTLLEILIFYVKGVINTTFGYKIIAIPFGVMMFVLSIIWLGIYNSIKTKKEKEESQRLAFELIQKENIARQQFAAKLIESEEQERNRIALELHDSIGQKLLLIKNRIHSLVNNFAGETSKEALIDVGSLTGETISEIRNITSNLHPPILEQVGLTSAIDVLVEKLSKNTKIMFNVFIDNIDKLIPPKDEINFYRIVQESINNIIKHSQASEAFVKIIKDGDLIILEIKDDGVGMERTKSKTNNGIGITGMKERAAILGSEIKINSDKNGTTIKMEYRRDK
ncbi:MAG: sensor histidine kinase [Ignavibacteriaceae bacterium]|jgi:signal transduction histidine kinase